MAHSVNLADSDLNNNEKMVEEDLQCMLAKMNISNDILEDGKNDTPNALEVVESNLKTVEHAAAATKDAVHIDNDKSNVDTCNILENYDFFEERLVAADDMAIANSDAVETQVSKETCDDSMETLNDSFQTAICMETSYESMQTYSDGVQTAADETTENVADEDELITDSEQPMTLTLAETQYTETCPKNKDKQIIFENRQECEVFIKRLCEESACEDYKVVLEMFNFPNESKAATKLGATVATANSVIDQKANHLMYLLHSKTLDEAGISPGNTRYYCFLDVIKSYIKVHAAKKLIAKLETIKPEPQLESENENKRISEVTDELLNVSLLYKKLCKSLENMDFFNENSAYKVFLEVRTYHTATVLRELMLTRVSRVFLCVVSTKPFLQLTEHEVVHLMKNCYLSVNSEIEIFLSVILWLEHTWFRRKSLVEYVLSSVRFNLLPIWYFTTMERANQCYHFARVIKMPCVRQMLQTGYEEAQILCSKAEGSAAVKQISVPLPRDWVADPATPHHHKQHCKHFEYPTIDVFKKYLKSTIGNVPEYWRVLRSAQEVYRITLKCCAPTSF